MKGLSNASEKNRSEDIDYINRVILAKKMIAVALIAVMGFNFVASSHIVRASECLSSETTSSDDTEDSDTDTDIDDDIIEIDKSSFKVKESVKKENGRDYKDIYSIKNKFTDCNPNKVKFCMKEVEILKKSLKETRDQKCKKKIKDIIEGFEKFIKDIKKNKIKNIDKIKELRTVISKDFDNNTIKYFEYKALRELLQQQGKVGHPYITILDKSKSIEKCLNAINDLEILKYILSEISSDFIKRIVSKYEFEIFDNFLEKQSKSESGYACYYGTFEFAASDLRKSVNNRYEELLDEEKNTEKKQIIDKINKGKFIDETMELEEYLESSKSAQNRSIKECLSHYVEQGGTLGCESIQRELRDMAQKVYKLEETGEIIVNFDADTYRQLVDIVNKIQEEFKSKTIIEDTMVYRGITIDGFIKMLKFGGINISEEDCSSFDQISKVLLGKVFLADRGFMSTSTDRIISDSFALDYDDLSGLKSDVIGVVFAINLNKGTHAIKVNEILPNNIFSHEKEVLLPPNTKLRINGVSFEKIKMSDWYEYEEKNNLINVAKKLLLIEAEVVE